MWNRKVESKETGKCKPKEREKEIKSDNTFINNIRIFG